jgi:isopenicillin N synthase-like dioxygenase
VQLDIRKSSGFKGYQPLLSSNNNPENMGDMHEGYEVGWEELNPESDDSKRVNDGAMAGSNVWPDELPGFREAVLRY